ncbi:MAG: TraB/GumN family protein [Rubrivivax sp.]|nr:TraB/GumN family protein [Rubrivivax sp.]
MRQSLAALAAGVLALASTSALAQPATACPPMLPNAAKADSAGTARDRGLLWRLTRDGRTSYLYGTLHIGKPAWRRLGPQLGAALRASDVLALEIDPSDPALLAALAELRHGAELPAALAERLKRAYARACVAPESLAELHPVLQATTLTVLEARWLGMDPSYAMEQLLGSEARALGRRVLSLETAAQQKAALVPDNDAEAQAVIEQSLQQLEDRSTRRVLARLAAAWEAGDLAALDDYEAWCECIADEDDRAFMRRLNDERNPLLADGIAALHRQGRRVFAAVGALHMTGPQSLPRLLQARGFRVERLPFGR